MIILSPRGRQHVSRMIIVALWGALMVGLSFGLMVALPLMQFIHYRDLLERYVPVSAVILSANPVPKWVHDHSEPDLEYEYAYGSNTYRSSRIRLWGNRSRESSDWFSSEFPPGTEFQAYVDPHDPANAVMFNDIPPRFQMLPATLIPIWSLLFPLMSPVRFWGRKWRHPELRPPIQPTLVRLDTQPYSLVWLLVSWLVLGYGLFTVWEYAAEVGAGPVIFIVILVAVVVPLTTGSITFTSLLIRARSRSYGVLVSRRRAETGTGSIAVSLVHCDKSSGQLLHYELTLALEAIENSEDPAFADLSNEWVRLKSESAKVASPVWEPLRDPVHCTWSRSTSVPT